MTEPAPERRIMGMKVSYIPFEGGIVMPEGTTREEFFQKMDSLLEAVDLMEDALAQTNEPNGDTAK